MNYKHGRMVGPVRALIDSGADFNLFPAEIGEYLGINIKKGEMFSTEGIGGNVINTYRHSGISIFVEGLKLKTSVDFSYEAAVPILGQQGFFDKFKNISFYRMKEEITLEF